MTTRGSLRQVQPTEAMAARVAEELATVAPDLVDGFRASLPTAIDVVNRRLVGAAYREQRAGDPAGITWTDRTAFLPLVDGGFLVTRASQHGFDRIEIEDPIATDPALLLERFVGRDDAVRAVGTELTDAAVNLALAYARRATEPAPEFALPGSTALADGTDAFAGTDADGWCRRLERLAVEGHNLHPCGRTRLGWSVPDRLAYDLESDGVEVGFVGVRRDVLVGDEIGPDLLGPVGSAIFDPARYAVTPVHPWQLELLRRRYPDAIADGALVPLPDVVPAVPTASLRTVLLPPGASVGGTRYLKLSLDIQVTSTRRSISIASTRNGPSLTRLLADLLDPDQGLLMAETAGSAARFSSGGVSSERDVSAVARDGLTGRLRPGEVPVPGIALSISPPVVVRALVDAYGRMKGLPPTAAAASFATDYARVVLSPLLRLAAGAGIGIEAHLQNCVVTFIDGVPHRLVLRDFAGMRLYPPRLGRPVELWPGSVVVTDDLDTMRAKVGYTAIQAHLGELVLRLAQSYGLDEAEAWGRIRAVIAEIYDDLAGATDAASHMGATDIGARAAADHAFFTAATVPHKALLTMRLAARRGSGGDLYVSVRNPLR